MRCFWPRWRCSYRPGRRQPPVPALHVAGHDGHPRIATTVLHVPAGTDPSEPHLAVDPNDPGRLYAVAQVQIPGLLTQELMWRTKDGGRRWLRSPLLGGADNTSSTSGFSVDPVIAAGGNPLVLFGAFTLDADVAAGKAILRIGTRDGLIAVAGARRLWYSMRPESPGGQPPGDYCVKGR